MLLTFPTNALVVDDGQLLARLNTIDKADMKAVRIASLDVRIDAASKFHRIRWTVALMQKCFT